jgi:DNA-binding NarL/FixJ family response regulator
VSVPCAAAQHERVERHLRLIVVDDRAHARRALRALLSTYADLVVVGEAADGAAAIELVAREQPDVVVMDLYMPVVNGLQAVARIKERWPQVRVIVLSAAAEAREHALAAGAYAFIAKDDPADALLATIRSRQT